MIEIKRQLKPKYTTLCLICNETVELSKMENSRLDHGLSINPKICDKCKQAILYARQMMENQGIERYDDE